MINFNNVTKSYGGKTILDDVSFQVETGEFVYLMGPSGSGKTTIFKLLVLIERTTKGEVFVDNYNIMRIKSKQIPLLRQQVGVIFQDFKLIQTKNVYENIALVLEVMGKKGKEIPEIIDSVLNVVNLKDKLKSFPPQLSGGEKQKVVIARALVSDPTILLADEPTGNLDPEATDEVVQILQKINSKGTTVIMATHDEEIVNKYPHKLLYLRNGKVKEFQVPKANYRDEYIKKKDNFEKSFENDHPTDVVSHSVNTDKSAEFKRKEGVFHKITAIFGKKIKQEAEKSIPHHQNIPHQVQPNISETVIAEKVDTNVPQKSIELVMELELPKDILQALNKRQILKIDEIMHMSDVTLSRIVGVINIWKVREAVKLANLKNK